MSLRLFLSNNIIAQTGLQLPEYVCTETIVDNPSKLISLVHKSSHYISRISWWDKTRNGHISPIGYGGIKDPKDPNYYFAETDICRDFNVSTEETEYYDYLAEVKKAYPSSNIFPAFDIK